VELLLLGHHLLDLLGGEIDNLHLLLGALHHLLLGGERLAGHAHGAHALLLLHHGLNLLGGEVDDLVLLLVLRREWERKGTSQVRNATICHCFPNRARLTLWLSRNIQSPNATSHNLCARIADPMLDQCSNTNTVHVALPNLPLFSQPRSPRTLDVAQHQER
jgi:hypothetical protein